MRLIDSDALIKKMPTEMDMQELYLPIHFKEWLIDEAPTIDAVPVVRCKDCRWGKEACGNIECFADMNVPSEYHGYEWFCPSGERKETDE